MKVKGPIFIGEVVVGSSDMVVDLSISTADLIAELEKRRPCAKCSRDGSRECLVGCYWSFMPGLLLRQDNFKEAK